MKNIVALIGALVVWGFALSPVVVAQSTGSLTGTVKDPSGAILPGTTVTLAPAAGVQAATATASAQGVFEFHGLTPGTYTVSIYVSGFAPYAGGVTIDAGQLQRLNVSLTVANVSEDVQVTSDAPHVDLTPENNSSSITVNTKNLDAFSDDPDELQAQLLALAGPSVGPNGGQLYVDGFTIDNGSLPPKSAIREIRINQNPFSAEYDRLGYGRVEILTKPGSAKLHGRFTSNGNDLAFDTADPTSASEPGYYSYLGTADVSGPLGKNGTFYADYQHRNIVGNNIINATNQNGPVKQTLTAPNTLDVAGPRFDYALGNNNIFTVSYQYNRQLQQDLGIGGLELASQGYTLNSVQHIFRVKDTQIVGLKFVNELSYQVEDQIYKETPVSTEPEILVAGNFASGGDDAGFLNYHHHHNEVDDTATLSLAKNTITFGGRLREVTEPYVSPLNFNGTYTFANLAAYEAGTPSQFSITYGNSLTKLFSEDTEVYITDDWKASKKVMLSYGMRFENQNYINDHADWAPRLSVAWGIGRKNDPSPKTVVRAGFGVFFDRFSQQLQLQVMSLNGIHQTEYVVRNPTFYNNPPQYTNPSVPTPPAYPAVPTAAELASISGANTVYAFAPNLHAPYTLQSAIGVEQQVSKAITLSVTYLNSRGDDQLISDNINAPQINNVPNANGTRPIANAGNIYEYESAAIFRQSQLITNVNVRAARGISLFGTYTLSHVKSDTGGAGTFPSNPYNITADYGRAAFDIRNRGVAGGTIPLKYGILLSPLLNVQSGTPFNITIGQDLIGSTVINQRPAVATPSTPTANLVTTRYGSFNTLPGPTDTIIPINSEQGPPSFVFNLRAGKTFTFGKEGSGGGMVGGGDSGPAQGMGGFRPGTATQSTGGGSLGGSGLGGGSGGGGTGGSGVGRYSFTVGAEARNLFNDVNLAPPIGNLPANTAALATSKFGQSIATAGGVYSFSGTNRRIDLQVAFNF